MFGSTLALMGAFDEAEWSSRAHGYHCERGCVFCHDLAIDTFRYWLNKHRPTAKLIPTSPALDLWARVRPNFNAPYQPIPFVHGGPTPWAHITPPCLRCLHHIREGALRIHVLARQGLL